jgi:two-component system chemotaxis response regulator CheB
MQRDIIVVGASAGGVEALCAMVSGLPADLPASVFVVLHLPPTAASALPEVLRRRTSLPTAAAEDDQRVEHGRIYVATPDYHLVLRDARVCLSRGAKENGHRPAVDTLFRSAARSYGPRVIGVVLSGTLDDGALGLRIITSRGGAAVVQSPDDAAFPGMPLSALAAVPRATVAPAQKIGVLLGEMSTASERPKETVTMTDERLPARVDGTTEQGEYPGDASVFTCPECHGTLFMTEEAGLTLFRCRVGHRYSTESLLDGESDAVDVALWSALRALEERNDLLQRLCERARRQGQFSVADRFADRVRAGSRDVDVLRRLLLGEETEEDERAQHTVEQ